MKGLEMDFVEHFLKRYCVIHVVLSFLIVASFARAGIIENEPNNLLSFGHIASEWLLDADGFELMDYHFFPGNLTDSVADITIDQAGNVYLTGRSKLLSATDDDDIVTIKYDPNGLQLWMVRYDGDDQGTDFPDCIAVDAEQNVYIGGSTVVDNASYDFLTIKYDSQGQQLWAKTYGSASGNAEHVRDLCVDSAGNVYVAGFIRNASYSYDCLTIKYDPDGTQLWIGQYENASAYGYGHTFVQLDETGHVYTAWQNYDSSYLTDCVAVKYDSNGSQLWEVCLEDIDQFYLYGQDLDTEGNLIIAGRGTMDGDPNMTMVTFKYDVDGLLQWVKGSGNQVRYLAQTVDPDGNIYVFGHRDQWPTHQGHTYKYDPNGVVLWSDVYEFQSTPDIPAAFMELDKDGHVIIAVSPGPEASTILKYDAQGNRIWTETGGCDIGGYGYRGLAVGAEGNFCVIGDSSSQTTGANYTVIKYDPDGQSLWQQYYEGGQFAFRPIAAIRNCQDTLYYGGELLGQATIAAYDTQGQCQWNSSTECSNPKAIKQDFDGNLFIGGHHRDRYASIINRYVVAKFDDSGNHQWTQQYGSPLGYNYGADIAIDSLGNSYITGHSYANSSHSDYLTIKYDPNGLFCWERRFDGADQESDRGVCVATDSTDSVIVGGYSVAETNWRIVTVKYDDDGNQLWTQPYPPDGQVIPDTYCSFVDTDPLNNIYVCGYTSTQDVPDLILIKYDPNGIQQWLINEPLTGYSSGQPRAMELTDDEYLYVAGTCYNEQNQNDILLMKYTLDGQPVWQEIYDHAGTGEDFRSFSVSDSGDVVIAFESIYYTDPWEESLVLLRYNADGEKICSDETHFVSLDFDFMGGEVILDADNTAHILGMLRHHPTESEQTVYYQYRPGYSCQPELTCDVDKDCECGMKDLLLFCENWLK